jgi:hypothetical protein
LVGGIYRRSIDNVQKQRGELLSNVSSSETFDKIGVDNQLNKIKVNSTAVTEILGNDCKLLQHDLQGTSKQDQKSSKGHSKHSHTDSTISTAQTQTFCQSDRKDHGYGVSNFTNKNENMGNDKMQKSKLASRLKRFHGGVTQSNYRAKMVVNQHKKLEWKSNYDKTPSKDGNNRRFSSGMGSLDGLSRGSGVLVLHGGKVQQQCKRTFGRIPWIASI